MVDWVSKRLGVNFPMKAEVMSVTLTHLDKVEATTILKAIVESYMSDVVNLEQDQKRNRLSELERVLRGKRIGYPQQDGKS